MLFTQDNLSIEGEAGQGSLKRKKYYIFMEQGSVTKTLATLMYIELVRQGSANVVQKFSVGVLHTFVEDKRNSSAKNLL